MRELATACVFALLFFFAWQVTGIDEALFAGRLGGVLSGERGILPDAGFAAARISVTAGLPAAPSLLLTSVAGWAAGLIILLAEGRRGRAAFAFHPAALLMAATGNGVAATGCLLLFFAIEDLMEDGGSRLVPALGLSVLIAAVTVPRFEGLLLALASPLFLAAPRPMLQQHLTSFYMIVFLPALILLVAAVAAEGLPAPVPREDPGRYTASGLLFLAGPALAMAAIWRKSWRFAAIMAVVALGALMDGGRGTLPSLMIAGLAAGAALRGRVPVVGEAAGAAAFLALAATAG